MPNIKWISELLRESLPAITKGVIPEAEERAAGAAVRFSEAKPPIERQADVPELGQKLTAKDRAALRSLPDPSKYTVQQSIQRVKEVLGGFFNAQPGLPKDIQRKAYIARVRAGAAGANANLIVKDRILSKLQGTLEERAAKVKLLQDFLVNTDDLANLERKFRAKPDGDHISPGGRTYDEVSEAQLNLTEAASQHPDLVQAITSYRNLVDEMFDTYVALGYITPDRRLSDYTPFIKLEQIMETAANLGGDVSRSKVVLDQLQKRTGSTAIRHTGVIRLILDQLEDLQVRAAEDQMFADILRDPTLHRTSAFKIGETLPSGWTRYIPSPGMPGYKIRDVEGNVLAGFMHELENLKGAVGERVYTTGYVLPSRVVRMLEEFQPPINSTGQRDAFKAGNWLARQMTVFNPANTILNLESDLLTAVLGLPGEKWRGVGVLRFYPQALKQAYKGVVKGEMSPAYREALQEGATSGTWAATIDGLPVDVETARLIGEDISTGFFAKAGQGFRAARQTVEAAPRIAAGLEAQSRGADFGEAARLATLAFGAGSPAHTRNPLFRFIFPFWQFMGLASERVFKLATTKGSRGRTLAAMAVPGVAALMWNHQNDDYRQAELALPVWEKDNLHIIVPDPADPSKPYRDKNDKPVALRIRWFITEEVARMFGLGNLPTRAFRVASGRDTPGKFAEETGGSFLRSVGQQAVPFSVAKAVAEGREQLTGREAPRAEIIAKSLPLGRLLVETVKGAMNEGAIGAAKRFGTVAGNVSLTNPIQKGKADADIIQQKIKLSEARKRLKSAKKKGDEAEARLWKSRVQAVARELQRLSRQRKKEQGR